MQINTDTNVTAVCYIRYFVARHSSPILCRLYSFSTANIAMYPLRIMFLCMSSLHTTAPTHLLPSMAWRDTMHALLITQTQVVLVFSALHPFPSKPLFWKLGYLCWGYVYVVIRIYISYISIFQTLIVPFWELNYWILQNRRVKSKANGKHHKSYLSPQIHFITIIQGNNRITENNKQGILQTSLFHTKGGKSRSDICTQGQ